MILMAKSTRRAGLLSKFYGSSVFPKDLRMKCSIQTFLENCAQSRCVVNAFVSPRLSKKESQSSKNIPLRPFSCQNSSILNGSRSMKFIFCGPSITVSAPVTSVAVRKTSSAAHVDLSAALKQVKRKHALMSDLLHSFSCGIRRIKATASYSRCVKKKHQLESKQVQCVAEVTLLRFAMLQICNV